MFFVRFQYEWLVKLAMASALVIPLSASATVARMQTVKGVIDVQLYDTATPLTVKNFIRYVKANAYTNSFFHRSISGFVVQGGGFTWNDSLAAVTTYPTVKNEFSKTRSNLRGTIAMAKLGTDPNSATSQWFFNLADNSGKPPLGLDYQNGGFTVFGKVLGAGMTAVDAIAALPTAKASEPFNNLPYIPPLTNNTVQKANVVLVSKVSLSAPATTKSEDRVFNYFEGLQPARYSPANALVPAAGVSKTSAGYYYRYYSKTKKYLAAANGKVYWGSALNSTMTLLGTVSSFLSKAAALGY